MKIRVMKLCLIYLVLSFLLPYWISDSNISWADAAMVEKKVIAVSLGYDHSAAVTEDGDLYCWGNNDHGKIGNGNEANQPTLVKVLSNVKTVSLGGDHSAALMENGDLYCWGYNGSGEIGIGTEIDQLTPVKVMNNVKEMSMGLFHSAALTENGDLYCWGYNSDGEIGIGINIYYGVIDNGVPTEQLTPVKVMSKVKAMSLGWKNSAAVTEDGDLYCWGSDSHGALGRGSLGGYQSTPVKVLSNVKSVSLGCDHSAAITEDGDLYCWGRNDSGQVGNGNREDQPNPIKVMSRVKMVSMGGSHSAAIAEDGALYCWGSNTCGQIGNGNMTSQLTPVKVMENVKSVSLGWGHSAAVTENSDLYCWGNNENGQIGDGNTRTIQKTPVKIMGSATTDTVEMTYLAMSELAYCTCKKTNGKTIEESGDLQTYINKQAGKDDKERNSIIPHSQFNLSNKQFVENLFEYIKDWKIVDTYEDKSSGFYAVALERGNEHVLSIRGSQNMFNYDNFKSDWLDNATYGLLEKTSRQMNAALYYTIKDRENFSGNEGDYVITGHSLGGGLGDFVGNYLGVKAITFDGSPTTDISYYRLPEIMSSNFTGLDNWNSLDYVNEHCPVGNLDVDYKRHISLTDRHTDANPFSAHARWAIVDYSNDELKLSPEIPGKSLSSFSNNTVVKKDINRISATIFSDIETATNDTYLQYVFMYLKYQAITSPINLLSKLNRVFPKGTLHLGGSANQSISASLKLSVSHTDVIYGGDGHDSLYGHNGDDYLVGGNGNDTLDGGSGDDKYIYWKGQGADTIIDQSGNDTLCLYGLSDNDAITFENDSDYVYVKNNGETIVKIKRTRNSIVKTNSFDVEVYGETTHQTKRLQDWNSWKNVKSITVACPTKVQIYDSDDNMVLELEDELDEPIYTDFGQFYTSEEDGEVSKHLLVENSYKVKIVATDDGIMDFGTQADDGEKIETLSANNIAIKEGDIYDVDTTNDVSLKKDGASIPLEKTVTLRAADIYVPSTSINMTVGEKQNASAQIVPSNSTEAIQYESLDSTVATVDVKGNITAVAAGECYISVFTESGITKNIKVVVKDIISNSKVNTSNNVSKTNNTYVNNPPKTYIKKLKVQKKALKVTWKKVSGIKGYKLQYSLNKKFNNAKTVAIKNAKTVTKTIKKLKAKKKYFIRIRTYKVVNGKTYYSKWSKAKSKKTK